MSDSKIHKLTVQEGHAGNKYIPVPTLVLKGKWLSEFGLTPRTKVEVIEQDCPLFVPLVESGFIDKDDPVTRLVIERYLEKIMKAEADTVILGCTHYPIIAKAISSVIGDKVTLIDSGRETAIYAAKILKENNLLNDSSETGTCEYYVSDTPDGFESVAGVFLGENVSHSVTQIDIEKY